MTILDIIHFFTHNDINLQNKDQNLSSKIQNNNISSRQY